MPTPVWRRVALVALVAAYLVLASTAWSSGSGPLSAFCVFALVTVVLGRSLGARKSWAWITWIGLSAGLVALTAIGHGRLSLDLVPVAINVGLAMLFGLSLRKGHMPLIARAIHAIEGPERLTLPRVTGYARLLTAAWAALFIFQALMFSFMLFWWLPRIAADEPMYSWATTYLHVGGLLLPALFMSLELVFRRWYLRHIPHLSLIDFMQSLVRNWPGLLRDSAASDDKEH